jgi:TPR repeat protein
MLLKNIPLIALVLAGIFATGLYCCPLARGDSRATGYEPCSHKLTPREGESFSDTINRYLKFAESGDPQWETLLGWLYAAGDIQIARTHNLGVIFRDGKGGEDGLVQAVNWWRKAADQGDADAQTNLGILYEEGKGISQNYEEAARFFKLAGDQGQSLAQRDLGNLYHDGKGVSQDYVEADFWYHVALKTVKSESETAYIRNAILEDEKHLNASQIETVKARTGDWVKRSEAELPTNCSTVTNPGFEH